jgi:hypothetical protein
MNLNTFLNHLRYFSHYSTNMCESQLQAVPDIQTFNFRTTRTFVHSKFSPPICLMYIEFRLLYTADEQTFQAIIQWSCPELYFVSTKCQKGVSLRPRRLRHGSTATHLPRLCFQIPPGALTYFSYECCVSSGKVLCDGPITVLINPTVCDVSKAGTTRGYLTRYSTASSVTS